MGQKQLGGNLSPAFRGSTETPSLCGQHGSATGCRSALLPSSQMTAARNDPALFVLQPRIPSRSRFQLRPAATSQQNKHTGRCAPSPPPAPLSRLPDRPRVSGLRRGPRALGAHLGLGPVLQQVLQVEVGQRRPHAAASPSAAAARFERHSPGPARRQQPQPVPLAPAERPGPAVPSRLQQRRGCRTLRPARGGTRTGWRRSAGRSLGAGRRGARIGVGAACVGAWGARGPWVVPQMIRHPSRR